MPSAQVLVRNGPAMQASPRAPACEGPGSCGFGDEGDEHAASANATVIQRMPSHNARAGAA